jgi:para-nitrobenzyl esterase
LNIAKTESGYISGTVVGEPANEVYIYQGIPYAAPPIADMRWKPPQPVAPWPGIRECTVFSNQAPQYSGPDMPQMPEATPSSEDCLYLNILTPAKKADIKLPVMVWLHGGGFFMGHGNSAMCNCPRLPQNSVVLVTLNMRLGPFGLMAHNLLSCESPHGVSGNYMFLDMIKALKWVQNNISAFGGDPNNVTIFGQSGGGSKVSGLMASPLARGLFHRAIIESGGLPHGSPLKEQEMLGEKLFARLGVNREPNPLAAARSLDWEKIIEATDALTREQNKRFSGDFFDAAVDGWFLTDTIVNIFKAGKQNAIPFILGTNLGELTGPFPIVRGQKVELVEMIPSYVDMFSGTGNANINGYAFVFNQVPGKWKEEGAVSCHGMELLFVFGAWDNKKEFEFLLDFTAVAGAKSPYPEPTEADIKMSKTMMRIWTKFAKTGDPNIKGMVTWPAYEAATDQYLYIAEPLEIKSGFSTIV